MIWSLCIYGKGETCNQLKQRIQVYVRKNGIRVDITTISTIDKIVDMVNSFDILLLDANDKKSKEIEKIISTRIEKEPILILFSAFYFDSKKRSYDFDFRVKSNTLSTLEITLNGLLSHKKRKKTILVYSNFNQICLDLDDVIYIEANNKKVGVRTINDFIITKETLTDIKGKIDCSNYNNFYKPHRSYLVNMKYIKSFNRKNITMYNDEKISVSRLKKDDFVKVFSIYLGAQKVF